MVVVTSFFLIFFVQTWFQSCAPGISLNFGFVPVHFSKEMATLAQDDMFVSIILIESSIPPVYSVHY